MKPLSPSPYSSATHITPHNDALLVVVRRADVAQDHRTLGHLLRLLDCAIGLGQLRVRGEWWNNGVRQLPTLATPLENGRRHPLRAVFLQKGYAAPATHTSTHIRLEYPLLVFPHVFLIGSKQILQSPYVTIHHVLEPMVATSNETVTSVDLEGTREWSQFCSRRKLDTGREFTLINLNTILRPP